MLPLTTRPIWPKLTILGIAALNGIAWFSVRAAWLGRDWGLWATSSGAVIVFITVMLWLETPATAEESPLHAESPQPQPGAPPRRPILP
jgi:hypothetical protein